MTLDEVHENPESSIYDRIVADPMQDDENFLDNNRMQVFRPLQAHGDGMHYRLLKEEKEDLASLVLAAFPCYREFRFGSGSSKNGKKDTGSLALCGHVGNALRTLCLVAAIWAGNTNE